MLDLIQREPQRTRTLDEQQNMDIVIVVDPITRLGTQRRCNQSDAFIMTNHFAGYATNARGFTDIHITSTADQLMRSAGLLTGVVGSSVGFCETAPDKGFDDTHFEEPAAGFQRVSKSALVTTLTLLNAIAAPAITGFSSPNAASGMPTRL